MELPEYPEYRTAAHLWVDSLPEHWNDIRFRFLLLDGYDGLKIGPFGSQVKLDDMASDGFKVYGQENVIKSDFTVGKRYLNKKKFEELSVYEISPGDLLITMMGTSGRCEIVPKNISTGIMDSHLIRLRVGRELTNEFARYLIDKSQYVKCQVDLLGNGSIMHGLNSTVIKSLVFHVPPVAEQTQIAKFLDYKTTQIDQLIEKKKALIEKLNEKRMALITQAVTKGLDPDVPMRDSEVEWLGEVPEHWQVRRLKFLLRENLTNGIFKKSEYWGRGTRVVNVTDVYIHNDLIDEKALDRLTCSEDEIERYLAVHGDFFIIRSSLKLEGIGKSATLINPSEKMVFECHVVRGCPDLKSVEPRFINFLLNSKYAREFFVSRCNVVTMATIGQDKLNSIFMPLPPYLEQEKIVQTLEVELSKVDKMIGVAKEAIEKIKEYRSALITAAVTGKIDVRGFTQGGK